jgi:probable F420-dependent oxidoreductase
MKYGVCLPTFRYGAEPTLEHIVRVARRAEDLGYDSVWAGDHVLVPADQKRMRFFTDPLVTLAYVAGFTGKLELGTSVVVAPLRNPLVLAKQAATLDYLSNGRLILGLGGGWLEREFSYLNVDFAQRGRMFDETLRILRIVWSDCPADFHGEFYDFEDAVLEPRPVQAGGPPLWIGGSSQAAFRRVAAAGDAWHADDTSAPEVAQARETILEHAEVAGRAPAITTRVTVKITGTQVSKTAPGRDEGYYRAGDAWSGIVGGGAELREQVEEFREAGSSHFIAQFEHGSVDEHIGCLETFASDVISAA